jgi:BASS family bile acid:Na+ symporter
MRPAPPLLSALLAPLDFCGRHATSVLFLAVFIGLAAPPLAALVRPLLPVAVVLLLTTTLLRLDWSAIGRELRRPGVQVLLFPWQQLALPVVVWLLLQPLPVPESLRVSLVLMAAAPPIMSSAALAILLGLDGALALVASLVATLLTPLILPPVALALLGLELGIGLLEFMGRLGLLVGLAVALALVLRRVIGKARLAQVAQPLDGTVVLLMLIFVVGIMDGVTERALADPGTALLWFLAAWLANPLLQLLGWLAFAWLGRGRALTVGLMSGNRNMGLLLAALPGAVDPDVALYFGLAQIPMYVLPAALRPLYRRLLPPESPVHPARESPPPPGDSPG